MCIEGSHWKANIVVPDIHLKDLGIKQSANILVMPDLGKPSTNKAAQMLAVKIEDLFKKTKLYMQVRDGFWKEWTNEKKYTKQHLNYEKAQAQVNVMFSLLHDYDLVDAFREWEKLNYG